MKNHRGAALAVILLLGVCFAVYAGGGREGNGDIVSRERPAGEFTGVTLNSIANVNIHFAAARRIVVTTDANIQDIVSTAVRKNMLTVGLKRKVRNAHTVVDVYMPAIDTVNLRKIGHIEIDEGSGPDLQIRHTGVGSINAQEYRAGNVTITGKGVGDIKIWAEDSLNGDWSGVGSVQYKGSPRINMNMDIVGKFEQLKQEEL